MPQIRSHCSQDTQADLALCIYVRIEACPVRVCCDALDARGLVRIVFGKLDVELEEAEFVLLPVRNV